MTPMLRPPIDGQRGICLSRRVEIESALRHLTPLIPNHEFGAVVDHALSSKGLRHAVAESAAWLSLVAYIRHMFTEYDALLAGGYDIESARFFVGKEIEIVLQRRGAHRTTPRMTSAGTCLPENLEIPDGVMPEGVV
jgi:hypothetical protein